MSGIGSSQNGLCVGLFNKREIQGRRVLTTLRNVFISGHTLLLFTGVFLPNSQSADSFHCLVALRRVIMFLGVRLNGRTYKRQVDQIQPCQSGTLAACWHVRAWNLRQPFRNVRALGPKLIVTSRQFVASNSVWFNWAFFVLIIVEGDK